MNKDLNVDAFNPMIEKIIDDLGFRTLPESELNDFRANLEFQLNRRLGLIIIENLDEDALKEYEEIMTSSEPNLEKISDIIKKNIPDYAEKIKEGLDSFISEIIAKQ